MASTKPSIIGTWEMIEAWDIGDNPQKPNEKTYPWGNPSSGYWVYDKAGRFSLIILCNPPLAIPADPFSGESQSAWISPAGPWVTPPELLVETFITSTPYAYFGTYKVKMDKKNPGSGSVIETVTADVMRSYTGTIQERPFSFDGNDFINVGVPGKYLRRLRRLT